MRTWRVEVKTPDGWRPAVFVPDELGLPVSERHATRARAASAATEYRDGAVRVFGPDAGERVRVRIRRLPPAGEVRP